MIKTSNPFRVRVKLTLVALGLVGLFAPAAAQAKDVHTVLELFTSQGCSSCPPADVVAEQLSHEAGLLVLSLPVDYWDYLGWKDTLSHSAFSARQRSYAAGRGDRQVYTPQMVINGMHHVVGSDRDGIAAATVAAGKLTVALTLAKAGKGYVVSIPAGSGKGTLWVMPVLRSRSVAIGRGENSGHTVRYTNIVRGLTKLGQWTGVEAQFNISAAATAGEANDAETFAVLLQEVENKRLGPIIGAIAAPGF